MEALKKKLGPLPRWAWIAIVLVGLLLYLRHRANQNAATTSSNNNSANAATDPYSSYATQAGVSGGYPYDASAVGGAYPLSGGMGSGFDPISFQEGLQYGQGFGTTNNGTQNDGSNPTNGAGAAMPPAQGADITVNVMGGSGPSTGGQKGNRGKRTTTGKSNTTSTNKHTSTGGGQQNRHVDQHIKTPATGPHKTTKDIHLSTSKKRR